MTSLYEVRLAGHLDDHWSTWFGGLTLTEEDDGTTTLRVIVADQAELHGLLARVRDLGAPLISITPAESDQQRRLHMPTDSKDVTVTASRSARERKAAAEAGPLATVKIGVGVDQQFVYKITCTECVARGSRHWSAYRPGADNGFMAAMDRWIFHLTEKHAGSDAPCLAYLPAAQQRLHERREG